MHSVNIQLPPSLLEAVRQLADKDQISVEQFVALALSEEVSALMTEDYLEKRAARGDRGKFEAALTQVSDVEPDAADRL